MHKNFCNPPQIRGGASVNSTSESVRDSAELCSAGCVNTRRKSQQILGDLKNHYMSIIRKNELSFQQLGQGPGQIHRNLSNSFLQRLKKIDHEAEGNVYLKLITYQEWVEMLLQLNESITNNLQSLEAEVNEKLQNMQQRIDDSDKKSLVNHYEKDIRILVDILKNGYYHANWNWQDVHLETVDLKEVFKTPKSTSLAAESQRPQIITTLEIPVKSYTSNSLDDKALDTSLVNSKRIEKHLVNLLEQTSSKLSRSRSSDSSSSSPSNTGRTSIKSLSDKSNDHQTEIQKNEIEIITSPTNMETTDSINSNKPSSSSSSSSNSCKTNEEHKPITINAEAEKAPITTRERPASLQLGNRAANLPENASTITPKLVKSDSSMTTDLLDVGASPQPNTSHRKSIDRMSSINTLTNTLTNLSTSPCASSKANLTFPIHIHTCPLTSNSETKIVVDSLYFTALGSTKELKVGDSICALAAEVAAKHDEIRMLNKQIIAMEEEIQKSFQKIQLKDNVIKEQRAELKSLETTHRQKREALAKLDYIRQQLMEIPGASEEQHKEFIESVENCVSPDSDDVLISGVRKSLMESRKEALNADNTVYDLRLKHSELESKFLMVHSRKDQSEKCLSEVADMLGVLVGTNINVQDIYVKGMDLNGNPFCAALMNLKMNFDKQVKDLKMVVKTLETKVSDKTEELEEIKALAARERSVSQARDEEATERHLHTSSSTPGTPTHTTLTSPT